jgi:putative ABC transport system permease protein
LEHFRDGHVSQELGIETGTNIENKQNLFSKARLYASNIDVVAELDDWLKKQHIETISRLAEIKNIKNINRVLGIIFNTIAITALIGCISSLIGSFLANVDRKRKNIAVLRLLGFTGPSIGLFIITQGLIITAIAYLGGYSLYFIGSETFNQTLASNQSTENLVCKITLAHSVIAFVISQIIATAVASIGAYRAIAIQPAESLREL